jgi:hypothetical protein
MGNLKIIKLQVSMGAIRDWGKKAFRDYLLTVQLRAISYTINKAFWG